jgi:hypothetical protein
MLMSLDNPTDRTVFGPELLLEMEEQMVKIRHNLKVAQDMQKRCANKGRNQREFKVGDHVFLKVKVKPSSLNLRKCSKLAMRYCGPFKILEMIGHVAYMIPLPMSLCIHNVFPCVIS